MWFRFAVLIDLAQALTEPVLQPDLFSARMQMALSLGWHIVIACFGVGFPVLIVVAEWRALRTDDEDLRELVRRWAKALAVLFAVGAVSGTILSFELGILWPGMMGEFGAVIGLPFAIEGIAFFIEAIFIGIYLYGWDRLSAASSPVYRYPHHHLWNRFRMVRRHCERVDEPAARVRHREWRGHQHRSLGCDVQPRDAGSNDTHDPGRVHGRWFRSRECLRVRDIERTQRPLSPARFCHPVRGRRDRDPVPDRSRRLGGALPCRESAGQARGDRIPVRDADGAPHSRSVGSRSTANSATRSRSPKAYRSSVSTIRTPRSLGSRSFLRMSALRSLRCTSRSR